MHNLFNGITAVLITISALIAIIIGYVIVSAYVGYFVGMAVAIMAGGILGASSTAIAVTFAWIFVGLAFVAFGVTVHIANRRNTAEVSVDVLDLIASITNDKGDD